MFFMQIILYLVIPCFCYSERVFVELADGGMSRPIEVMPLEHDHSDGTKNKLPDANRPQAEALSAGSGDGEITSLDDSETQDYDDVPEPDKSENGLTNFHNKLSDTEEMEILDPESPENPTEVIPTRLQMEELESTVQYQSPAESEMTSQEPKHLLPCHQDCMDALAAMSLYVKPETYISQGSNLTLTCELPLNSSFILEDLDWLYHPENTPTHQCSLIKSEFLPQCEGFHTIIDTDDRNNTFIQDSITITNVLLNHSGQYMCQVKLTCCMKSKEHVMNKEKEIAITIQINLTDYTIDLAIAGSIALTLAIVVIGGNYYISRRQNNQYIFITDDVHEFKASAVLHIPLVDDDNDSFDSNFDAQ
ncbi:uncharacterized protein [Palaemon carinicauda]|uniref:uncharacterized protein n=1 Tax=Palaemon carinicauda TaxID=392227 RepID=UPI0035B66BEC